MMTSMDAPHSRVLRGGLLAASSTTALGLRREDIVNLYGQADERVKVQAVPIEPPSLSERVFDALAAAKIWTSRVAMHLARPDRDRVFRQLDLLHDCDDWFDGDSPIELASFKSFIRFMLSIRGNSKPSLTLASDGLLSAIWLANGDRLTIEFGTDETVRWVVSQVIDGQPERAGGVTSIGRVLTNLAAYDPEKWFNLA